MFGKAFCVRIHNILNLGFLDFGYCWVDEVYEVHANDLHLQDHESTACEKVPRCSRRLISEIYTYDKLSAIILFCLVFELIHPGF